MGIPVISYYIQGGPEIETLFSNRTFYCSPEIETQNRNENAALGGAKIETKPRFLSPTNSNKVTPPGYQKEANFAC